MEKSKEFFEFKKKLDFLKAQRGEGTELISVYMKPNANIADTVNRLRDEYSQSMNIKSKHTRKNVQDAIDRILQMLKGVHKAPETGIAVFSGSIGGKVEIFSVHPPVPVNVQIYRCDSTFYLDPLFELIAPQDIYGLFVMDRREATIAMLKGKHMEIMVHMTSNVPGKHHKGGQSALRYERLIEQSAEDFFHKICEHLNQIMKDPKVRGVIAGGPGATKNEVVNSDRLYPDVKNKIIGVFDTSYTDEFGIKELMERAADVMKKLDVQKEKDLVNRFIKDAVTGGPATYGINDVKEALNIGKVEILLLSEKLDEAVINELTQLADSIDAKVEMISIDTPEGEQFYSGFRGIGAILRYN